MREARSRDCSLSGPRGGNVMKDTVTRVTASRTGTCVSELALVLLGGLGAAWWGRGVRWQVDVSPARGERAYEREDRHLPAMELGIEAQVLIVFVVFDGSVEFMLLAFVAIGAGLFLNFVFSTDTVAGCLRFSAIIYCPTCPPLVRPCLEIVFGCAHASSYDHIITGLREFGAMSRVIRFWF